MRTTAAFQSDLNLFYQLLAVLLLPPNRLDVAAPCCSRPQCFSSPFSFFCLSSRGIGCCPQRCPDHSPQPSYCLLSLLQPARHIKKRKKEKNPPFSPRGSVLSAVPCVFLVVSGWSQFSPPRVVAMLPGANLLPPRTPPLSAQQTRAVP